MKTPCGALLALLLFLAGAAVAVAQPRLGDRVYETTTTTGTGTLSLGGAVSGYRTFVTGIGSGNAAFFCIVHRTVPEWECGSGTVTDATPDTLTRTTRFSSSTGGAVSFSAGTKDVFVEFLSGIIPPATEDAAMVGNGSVWQAKVFPSCSGASDALAYNTGTNTFTCNTIASGGASIAEPYLTTTATGGLSNEFALGSLATGLLVNTITTGIPTVLVPTDDNTVVGSGTAWQLKALPTCSGATSALTYNVSTNAYGCNTIASGGNVSNTGTPTSGQLATWTSSTVIQGVTTLPAANFPGLTGGDVTNSPGSLATTIANDAVTYAKMQNVSAASKLLGRGDSGSGDPQEITSGAGLNMTGTTLSSTPVGGGGDFSSNTSTSVDSEIVLFSATGGKTGKRATGTGVARVASGVLSAAELSGDVTTSGSNAATIANNAVTYAKLQDVSAASRLVGRGSAAGAGDPQEITLGTNLSMSGTTLNATGGGGSSDTVAVVAADVSITESTTLINATGLLVAITASATEQWEFTCGLLANADIATSDFKFGFTVPAAATMLWSAFPDQGVGIAGSPNAATQATTLSFGGIVGTTIISLRGVIFGGGTAGNVQLQFAQVGTPAGTQINKILKGSWCRYAKIVT